MVKYYEDFLNLGCFSFEDAEKVVGSRKGALAILSGYVGKGYIAKVRRGLYVAMDIVNGGPVLDRYRIASRITDDAVVAYHTAFAYYGHTNQVSYCTYVATERRFEPFEFDGSIYMKAKPTIEEGVVRKGNVAVTDLERTVLDCIDDFSMCLGFEEFTKCLSSVSRLNESRLRRYLPLYDKKVMYQKAGFVFERFGAGLGIGKGFLDFCREGAGTTGRLLPKWEPRPMELDKNWNLLVPKDVWRSTLKYEEVSDEV